MEPEDPITAEEVLLRRVPEVKMSADRKEVLPDAFAPDSTRDKDGISLYRAAFHTPEEVAAMRTKAKSPCYIAHILAADILRVEPSLRVMPDPLPARDDPPLPAQPGHSLIPEMNSDNYKEDGTESRKAALAALVFKIDGPYEPTNRAIK